MAKYLILSVNKFDFINDDGERIEGMSVHYCDTPEKKDSNIGSRPMKISAPKELFPAFTNCPGVYDLDFTMKPDSKGKPSLALHGAKFASTVVYSLS